MSASERIKSALARKEARQSHRASAKAIRQGDLKGKARRNALKANRVAMKATRTAWRDDRKTNRVTLKTDRQSAKITKLQLKDSWKAQRKTVSKADRSFHTMAAKQKQMKEWEYYDKYVK
jgi:hypothetical protein